MRWRRAMPVLLLLAAAGQAADRVLITLTAQDQPVGTVLREIARQAGRELQVTGTLPDDRITLELRHATLEAALLQVCGRIGRRHRVTTEAIHIEPPPVPGPAPEVKVEGVPAVVLREAGVKLDAVVRDPTAAAAVTALGDWLRAQRPDWRLKLSDRLPDLWQARAAGPGAALAGAQVCLRLGLADAARRLLPVARRAPEHEVEARCLAAGLELQRGNASRALAELAASAREAEPGPAEAALKAEAALYLGRDEEALADAEAAAARWPADPAVLATLGNVLRRQPAAAGDADRYLQEALVRSPGWPDALFGQALLTAREAPADLTRWTAFLAREPYSVRAERVRLGLAATDTIRLTERGGPAMDVSRDGQRILYFMKFRKQLEVTDTSGFALANQVTDQDTEKVGASLSPDEQELAWIVPAADGDRVFVQGINASGKQEQVVQAQRGASLRRTNWSPDGRYVLFTETAPGQGEPAVRLRCWDHRQRREVELPARLRLPGLGDVTWRADGWVVGTVTVNGRQAVVAQDPAGWWAVLRPAAAGQPYRAPAVDQALGRVVWQGSEPIAARTDAAEGGEVPVLAGASSTEPAFWLRGDNLLVTVSDVYPSVLRLAGLPQRHRLLAQIEPLLAAGPKPPKYTFRLRNPSPAALSGALTATVVADDGARGWTTSARLNVPAGGVVAVPVAPLTKTRGTHWLRVDLVLGGRADAPRWYRFEVTG